MKEQYIEISKSFSLPCYFQPWWLDIVSPNCWDVVIHYSQNEPVGFLVYSFKKLMGRLIINMPEFTTYSGLYFLSKKIDPNKIVESLFNKIPPYYYLWQDILPSIQNFGFPPKLSGNILYTYCIDVRSIDNFEDLMSSTLKKKINSVSKDLTVFSCDFEIWRSLVANSKIKEQQKYSSPVFCSLDNELTRRGQRLLIGVKSNDKVLGAGYFIKDNETVRFISIIRNPQFANSFFSEIIINYVLNICREEKLAFDFEGSILENVDYYLQSFGAFRKRHFRISSIPNKFLTLGAIILNKGIR